MTDLRPGQRVRVCADAEVVQMPNGRLGVLIDDRGHPVGQTLFDLAAFDVRPTDEPAEYQWSLGVDGEYLVSDESNVRHAATRDPASVVCRRTVGPWEEAPDD